MATRLVLSQPLLLGLGLDYYATYHESHEVLSESLGYGVPILGTNLSGVHPFTGGGISCWGDVLACHFVHGRGIKTVSKCSATRFRFKIQKFTS